MKKTKGKSKREVHLICNAHLDPVWQWQWEEGAAETISTFTTAAELCEKYDRFIFNHNESLLYEWILEYAPNLFSRIQKLVKQGRWHIMGGWYLQPDCNMPTGESFVRQIQVGKAFFKKHFNVEPKTAINFDPFGHTQGLVQILKKSGFDSYLIGRPMGNLLDLPSPNFTWVGYDGSEVTVTRFPFGYNTNLGEAAEKINARIDEHSDWLIFPGMWGVGNHGGGPSKRDLKDIEALIDRRKDVEIKHSTPEMFFKALRKRVRELPKVDRDLNPFAVGCYTSQIRVKQEHRRLESELYMTEKMCSAAWLQKLIDYPQDELQEALKDLLLSEFHDSLPGSSIPEVEEQLLRVTGHGREIVSRLRMKAFMALMSDQKMPADGVIPLFVYNPHAVASEGIIDCEFTLPDFYYPGTYMDVQVYADGKPVPTQIEQEAGNIGLEWRKRVVFRAKLQPGRMNRFECRTTKLTKKPQMQFKPAKGKINFKTKDLQVTINTRTGLVDRLRVKGKSYLAKGAFCPVALNDDDDSWGMSVVRFDGAEHRFKLMNKEQAKWLATGLKGKLDAVRVIEDGPVRTVVEAFFIYNRSFVILRYHLPKKGTEIHVQVRACWNEKQQLLKLEVPVNTRKCEYWGQTAFGRSVLPANGDEVVAQKWNAVVSRKDNKMITCINDGTYGSDFRNDAMRLTLLRSPAYTAEPLNVNGEIAVKQDRYIPRMEQGERIFNFFFDFGSVATRSKKVDFEALMRNEKPMALSMYPRGKGARLKPLAQLTDSSIQISTIKKSEKGSKTIVRLYEPLGRRAKTVLKLPILKKRITLTFEPFEIKTIEIGPRTGKHNETDLLERKI